MSWRDTCFREEDETMLEEERSEYGLTRRRLRDRLAKGKLTEAFKMSEDIVDIDFRSRVGESIVVATKIYS